MPAGLRVFFSHRVENLYRNIKEQLFDSGSHPFAQRMVVVPSPAMKTWLNLKLAKDPTCGIAAGLDVGYVDQTMRKLVSAVRPHDQREASRLELAMLIEAELTYALAQNDNLWDPVKNFVGKSLHASKSRRRLTSLSLQLAKLFEKYGIYGSLELSKWGNTDVTGWQKVLWKRVWEAASQLTYPTALVNGLFDDDIQILSEKNVEVHLFSISFLPALYYRLLSKLSKKIPVNYYILSPCQAFWSDIKSDRESHRMYAAWKAQGVSQAQLLALEDFLRDRNPLLANFGRLGREMAEQVENSDCVTEEMYSLPAQFSEIFPYEQMLDGDILLEPHKDALTLLDCVQADLMLLRNPIDAEKIAFAQTDRSIQIHVCPGKRREVENLSNVLKGIMSRHQHDEEPIRAGDIIVMAPDIMDYEPYIKVLFGSEKQELDYQLMEVDLLSQSMFAQAFSQLLQLASGRWDAASVISFLESALVQKKLKFTADDVRKFREWVQEAGIRWGENTAHCNEILQRNLCENPLVDNNQPGTWEEGLGRLLAGLAFTESTGEECRFIAPLEIVDTTAGELLGRWIEFLQALKSDLKPLQDGTLLRMEQWVAYLKSLIEAYFAIDSADREECENRAELIRELDKLAGAAQFSKQQTFAYASIEVYLEHALQTTKVNYREGRLDAVRFCSLLPMRALPAKVVVLLGLQDSDFPRSDESSELDLLKGKVDADYIPLQNDFDRSLFLEAILSARKYFVASFSQFKEGREETPSILLTEFMSYLDSAYECEGRQAAEVCTFKHHLYEFDAAYFQEESPFPNYALRGFKAASAYYHCEKQAGYKFIPRFERKEKLLAKGFSGDTYVINLNELTKMAKNPIRTYFNNTLGMYVNETSKRHMEVDEKFEFDNLDMHFVKEESLAAEIDQILHRSQKEGILPAGLFKEIAEDKMRSEVFKIEKKLTSLGVDKSDIFEIHLSQDCEEVMQIDKGWRCPPLILAGNKGNSFTVVGTIKNVSHQGLLVLKEGKFDDLIDVWPQYLVYMSLIKKWSLPIKPFLLPLKDGKIPDFNGTDHSQSLCDFLDYYLMALHEVSPLLPKWMKPVMASDVPALEKMIQSNLGRSESYFFNDYAKWCFQHSNSYPNAEEMALHWQGVAKKVFGPLEDVFKP